MENVAAPLKRPGTINFHLSRTSRRCPSSFARIIYYTAETRGKCLRDKTSSSTSSLKVARSDRLARILVSKREDARAGTSRPGEGDLPKRMQNNVI